MDDSGRTIRSESTRGSGIAGTLDFAAPEQLGKHPGISPGPYTDVFGFAKTCCFCLFGTTQPLYSDWKILPGPFVQFLEDCLREDPRRRPQSLREVLTRLKGLEAEYLDSVELVADVDAQEVAVQPVGKVTVLEETREQPQEQAIWHFMKNGQQIGPLKETQLRQMIKIGQVTDTDMVWRIGMSSWQPLSDVTEVLPQVQPSKATKADVSGHIHLDGVGGSKKSGKLRIYLDRVLIGTGSALLGVHLPFQSSVGMHVLTIKGSEAGMLASFTGTEKEFGIHFEKPGKYAVNLGWESMSGKFALLNATGGTPPTSVKVTMVE